MPRTSADVGVEIALPDGDLPLRHRISDALVAVIARGGLLPGDPVPSSRALARHLDVPRSAVVAGYDELCAAGYLVTRAGAGTVVAPGADKAAARGVASHVSVTTPPGVDAGMASHRVAGDAQGDSEDPGTRWTMRAGVPDSSLVDERAWRRAWGASARRTPDREKDPLGPYELRAALVQHLRRSRGIVTDAEHLVCLPGVGAGLRALLVGLGLPGRVVALEDPGYRAVRQAVVDVGVTPRFVGVDEDGLDPSSLMRRDAACYVTPAHQFPLGSRMSVERRQALTEWASHGDRLILEDDYDGEFRYDVSPLPALASMSGASEHVVYMGTASKMLTPAVRLAWAVVPDRHLAGVAASMMRHSSRVDLVAAGMLTRLITSGDLTRHLARVAREYRTRREALRGAVERHLPGSELLGVDAGLHLVLALDEEYDDAALVQRLAERGLDTEALSGYYAENPRRGLVLGYAQLPATQADAAVATIAAGLPIS